MAGNYGGELVTKPRTTNFGPGGGPGGVGGGPSPATKPSSPSPYYGPNPEALKTAVVKPSPIAPRSVTSTPSVTNTGGGGGAAAGTWTNPGIATNPGSGVPAVAPPPPGPMGPSDPGSGLSQSDQAQQSMEQQAALAAQRQAELEAALRSLESQFNLSREELLADQTEAGDQYRFIMSALQRQREDSLMMTQSGALQRGILRSGIYLSDEAKVNQEFASKEAEAAASRTANQNAIQKAIADLESSHAQGLGATSATVVQQQLQSMRQLADNLALDDRLGIMASEVGFVPGLGGQAPGVSGGPGAAAGVGAGLGGGRALNPFDSTGLPDALAGTNPQGQPTGTPTAEEWMARQRANLLAGPAGGAPVSGKIFEGEGPYHAGQFANLTGAPQVLGGQGGQTVVAEQYAPSSGNPMGSGTALFGSPKVDVNSFLASLGPSVQSGLTEQDKANIIAHYGATGIPADAAYGIAASASRIGAQAQDSRYQWR